MPRRPPYAALSLAEAGIALEVGGFSSAATGPAAPGVPPNEAAAPPVTHPATDPAFHAALATAAQAAEAAPAALAPFALDTPPRVPKAPNAAMRAAGRQGAAGLTSPHPAVVVSPEGLFPRASYELEIWYHLAAVCELLRAAEYPEGSVGIGAGTPYCIQRGPKYCPPPPEQAERLKAAGRRWAERWVRGRVGARLADGVRAFAADEAAQLWAHGWMRSRKGVSIHYRNWGAMTLGLLLGAEPEVQRWVGDLYAVFLRQGGDSQPRGSRLALQLEGFTWCPRLATHERFAKVMRAAPAGTPAPAKFDPMDTRILATSYRIQERLAYEPDRHTYGSLEPGRAQPTTHLEFAANLSRHDQRAEQGDVQLVFSQDSHTLSCEDRLARLLHFARHPPDLAEIERRCFGVEPAADGVQRVWCSVSEAAVAAACRPLARETPGHNLGTELTQSLGVALRRAGRHRSFNPSTSPLWVGPATRAELPAGRILGWPANLVHGWPNTNGLSSACHMTKTLCFASSFQQHQEAHQLRHPQEAVWRHCWGIADWTEVVGPLPPVRALVRQAVPQPIIRPRGPRRPREGNAAGAAEGGATPSGAMALRVTPSEAKGSAETASEAAPPAAAAEIPAAPPAAAAEIPAAPEIAAAPPAAAAEIPAAPPAARKRQSYCQKVHALGDVETATFEPGQSREDELLLRTAADLTHHATRLDSYSNQQAFAFMFKFVPETRVFFSMPHQLARALILRFPETYPPDTTDPLALARRLLRERRDFQAPAEVQRMLRTLWDMFAPA